MFIPLNRHILIKREESGESVVDRSFVLPDPYEVVVVLAASTDCKLIVSVDDKIVVERSMVNSIVIEGDEYYLVLENYVFGAMKT